MLLPPPFQGVSAPLLDIQQIFSDGFFCRDPVSANLASPEEPSASEEPKVLHAKSRRGRRLIERNKPLVHIALLPHGEDESTARHLDLGTAPLRSAKPTLIENCEARSREEA